MTLAPLIVPTRSAHWGWDEHRYFGHKVFEELAGHESLMGLTALSVTGRRLPPEACAVLEDAASALTLADPRIWPLKLTRVIASYGGMAAAAAAGLLIQEGAQIGPWVCGRAAEVLLEFQAALGDRIDDPVAVRVLVEKYLTEHPFIWGFGTPFRSHDERLVAFRACIERRERQGLPFWRTMEAVASAVRDVRGVEPNIGFAMAAACLDLGLGPDDIGPLVISLVQHLFVAHAVEGSREASPVLRQLPDSYVRVESTPARESPRQQASSIPLTKPHYPLHPFGA